MYLFFKFLLKSSLLELVVTKNILLLLHFEQLKTMIKEEFKSYYVRNCVILGSVYNFSLANNV